MDRTSCDLNGKYDKRDMSTTQCDFNPNACNHINIFKNQQEGRKIYNTIHSHFIACTTPAYRRLKVIYIFFFTNTQHNFSRGDYIFLFLYNCFFFLVTKVTICHDVFCKPT